MRAIVNGLLYPTKLTPLALILIFSVLAVLANSAGLPGIPLGLILISWFLKYSFVMFDDITLGRAEPSVLSMEMVNPANEQRPLGVLAIVAVFYSAAGLLHPLLGAQWVEAIRAAELILLPASAATLGVTGHILEAVNPATLLGFVRRMGALYLGVVLSIAAIAAIVFRVVLPHYGGSALALTLSFALALYGWLAMFGVLGMALYERRTEFELETWYSPEQTEVKERNDTERDRDRFVDELYVHWRTGSYRNAWSALARHVSAASQPTEDMLWIHERVARWPDRRMAVKMARDLLPRLLEAKRNSEALQLTRQELLNDGQFRPAKSSELVRLIYLARDVGDRATARKLMDGFDKRFPDDPAGAIVARLQDELAR